MAFSQSQFLQALGWATLNSLWQMGLLWAAFIAINFLFRPSAANKYKAAVVAILLGFAWFVFTAFLFYQQAPGTYSFFENSIPYSDNILRVCLLSASLTYLLLLAFPVVRLVKNWRFVQRLRQHGQLKAQVQYRLFVQRIAAQLGIAKKVKLVVSNLVSSPVTVGFLKPVILLPVAAMNQLTVAQVEAILLHELSHIRRYDYLLNLIVSVIHVLLYFNPFVKTFMKVIEDERENCCDEAVLQFGYDKLGYASALLHLEKWACNGRSFLLAAAGRQNLLTRIEKIVGMEKKKPFKLLQLIPLLAATACVLLFNSVLLIQDAGNGAGMSYTADAVLTPWQLNATHPNKADVPVQHKTSPSLLSEVTAAQPQISIDITNWSVEQQPLLEPQPTVEHLLPVDYDDVDGRLTADEQANVKTAVEGTKKVVAETQWKQIDAAIGEVLTDAEKVVARKQYNQEIENINWNNVEQNLKANYDKLNWESINEKVNFALAEVKFDSVNTIYAKALKELQKLEKELKNKATVKLSLLPDCSVEQISMAKETLSRNLDSIKSVRPKKIVRL